MRAARGILCVFVIKVGLSKRSTANKSGSRAESEPVMGMVREEQTSGTVADADFHCSFFYRGPGRGGGSTRSPDSLLA